MAGEQEAIESTEAPETGAEQTQQAEAAPAESTGENTGTQTSDAQNEAQAGEGEQLGYTPNFKFKVQDEEHEIDDFLKEAIKDPESEKKLRELYEKAYGLDHIKPKHEKLKTEFSTLENNWTKVTTDLQKLGLFIKNKDYGSLFTSLKLTDQDIIQYAIERLNYYEMPEEKRAALDVQAQRNRQLADMTLENQSFKTMQQQQAQQNMMSQLQQQISMPEIAPLAQHFDTQAGKAGAFQDAVIRHAVSEYHLTGRDMLPDEAVKSFIQFYGVRQPSQATSQAAPPASGQQAARAQTLPKMSSSGASPVKTKIKSIDDIKKLRDQMQT